MKRLMLLLPLLIVFSGCCHMAKSICGGLPESSCKQALDNWNSHHKDLTLAIQKHQELKKALTEDKTVKEAISKNKELSEKFNEVNFDKDDIDSINTLNTRTVNLLKKGAGLDKKTEENKEDKKEDKKDEKNKEESVKKEGDTNVNK